MGHTRAYGLLVLGLVITSACACASGCDGRAVGQNDDDAMPMQPDSGPLPTDALAPAPDALVPETCGNGVCDPGETATDCAAECAARSVATGAYHSCAVLADGTGACWGFNRYGQLGDGTQEDGLGRRTVLAPQALRTITAGWSHTCALGDDGTAWCWGRNKYGQLGMADDVEESGVPLPVVPLGPAVELSAGQNHTCAVRPDHTVWCWGANSFGQLGDGTDTDRTQPVRVSSLEDVVAVRAGGEHTCALEEDGSVWCWGRNHRGQLGNGASQDAPLPGLVATIPVVDRLSTGDAHTCVQEPTTVAWCWGSNEAGQLGSVVLQQSQLPLRLGADHSLDRVVAGEVQTCAVLSNGGVRCWGLADLSGDVTGPEGLAIGSLPAAGHLDVGAGHGCAADTLGNLWCWGQNQHGQLGGLLSHDSQTPVLVRAE